MAFRDRVYLDLEYMYPGMSPEKGRPTAKEKRQVVQMAAIIFRYDNEFRYGGREVESFQAFTFPTFDRKLPQFFVELTGITQKELEKKGVSFKEGLIKLHQFACNGASEYPVWTFNLDQEVLEQNCGYLDIPFPFRQNFTRVKPHLRQWCIDPEQYSSGTLYQAVGLKMEGHIHNALHDVRSMANAVYLLEGKPQHLQANRLRITHYGEFIGDVIFPEDRVLSLGGTTEVNFDDPTIKFIEGGWERPSGNYSFPIHFLDGKYDNPFASCELATDPDLETINIQK